MAKQKKEKMMPDALAFFIAGAGSGTITKTTIAPLERVKLLYQVLR